MKTEITCRNCRYCTGYNYETRVAHCAFPDRDKPLFCNRFVTKEQGGR